MHQRTHLKHLLAGLSLSTLIAGTAMAAPEQPAPVEEKANSATEATATGSGTMNKCPNCKKHKGAGTSGCGGASGCGGTAPAPDAKQPAQTGKSGCGGASGCSGAHKATRPSQ